MSTPPPVPSVRCEPAELTAVFSDSRVEKVLVLTSDSRTLVGTLLSYDQMTNLVCLPYLSIVIVLCFCLVVECG